MDNPVISRKPRGDFAELVVAADLRRRGHRIAFPVGEDCPYDLVVERADTAHLERIQVKLARSRPGVLLVQCWSHSLTNGKVGRTAHYTAATIDWLAAVDRLSGLCYYIPAESLGDGKSDLTLRLEGTRNGQAAGIRWANEYLAF